MSVVLYWQEGQDIPFFPYPERDGISAQIQSEVGSFLGETETGGFVLNPTIQENHQVIINYTENPVERGRIITDHAYIMPDELTIDVMISNDSGAILGGGLIDAITTDQIYSNDVFEYLEKLAKQNVLLVIETPLKVYENMTIRDIKVNKDKNTNACLSANIFFKQVSFAYTSETDPLKPQPDKAVSPKEKRKTKKTSKKGKTNPQSREIS